VTDTVADRFISWSDPSCSGKVACTQATSCYITRRLRLPPFVPVRPSLLLDQYPHRLMVTASQAAESVSGRGCVFPCRSRKKLCGGAFLEQPLEKIVAWGWTGLLPEVFLFATSARKKTGDMLRESRWGSSHLRTFCKRDKHALIVSLLLPGERFFHQRNRYGPCAHRPPYAFTSRW
jgi:hypothetical protein